jgi:hypothetical protein
MTQYRNANVKKLTASVWPDHHCTRFPDLVAQGNFGSGTQRKIIGNAQQMSRVEAERMLTMGHWSWDFSAQ